MRTPFLLAALLLATPLALAGPLPSPYGDHYVGPCDYWTSQFTVGDSYRLTCVVDGQQLVYFHQGQAGLAWECDYWVDGHDLYHCGPLPAQVLG